MDGSAGLITKRRRSVDQEDGSRPSQYQPSSPTWLLEPIHIDTTDMDDLAASGSADTLLPDLAGEPAGLLLLDQDEHLLDFADTPPAGGGGSCELYIAVHRPTNAKLAMKRLRFNFPTEDMLRRFRREAEIWARFRHPNILPFFGSMKIRHRIYIVSPWRRFGDLLAFIQTRIKAIREGEWFSDLSIPPSCRSFTETKAVREIAAGLAYLHAIGVVHGDMKAKNVLLTDEGRAQICDFGLTKTLDHSITSTELKGVGSIRWQSPELLHDVPKSPESDIYAFGMTIAEILTGNYPFPHLKENTAVVCAVILRNERPIFQPSSLLGVDFEPLWRVAARCWETKPEDRPQIGEVVQQLTPPPTRAFLRLTRDILQHIIFTPPYRSDSDWRIRRRRYKVSRETDSAITISHVCQSWRLAATKSPSVWSKLQFHGGFPFNLQNLQIERSEGAAIAIEISGDYDIRQTKQLIQLLRPHVTRWKVLRVTRPFKNGSYRLFFDELHDECAPMLETLDVNSDSSNWKWGLQPFSRGTPKLADLTIGHYQLSGHPGLFNQLTHLKIRGRCARSCKVHPLGPQDLLVVLAQCASTIVSVTMDAPHCMHVQPPNPLSGIISLPHLTNLVFALFTNDQRDSFNRKIYSQVTAPQLQSFTLQVSDLEHLRASLTTLPFPNLSSLSINPSYGKIDRSNVDILSAFKHTFSQLPQLQELTIDAGVDFDLKILELACGALRKLTMGWSWPLLLRARELSGMKDMIELRQLRARERGTKDSLVEVILYQLSLSAEDYEWLKSHLEVFHCN